MPLYALYALLFRDTGVSEAGVSALFAIWSAVGIVAEVPAGALADRFSRRNALVAAGVLQAAGYALWVGAPGFGSFAGGFALWALGGALVSGSLEALLYDGLAAVDATGEFGRVLGGVTAAGLLAQLPAAGAAALLFGAGGYALVGWVSVGTCLAGSALAATLPEPSRPPRAGSAGPGFVAALRAGVVEAAARPGVRTAIVAVALLTGLDAFEEYVSLLAQDWGVPTRWVPLAVLLVPVAGAVGATCGGRAGRLRPGALAALLGCGAVLLAVAGWADRSVGLVGVGVFYGLYRVVLVVAGTRLQERIDSSARATVTSVAGLGSELGAFAVYAVWAWGAAPACALLVAAVAAGLPWWLRPADHGRSADAVISREHDGLPGDQLGG